MLVLTRKAGQSIRIGESIIIKIFDIDGSQVKIAIEAPKGIAIFREELYEKLKESNIEALKSSKELDLTTFISQSPCSKHSYSDTETIKESKKGKKND